MKADKFHNTENSKITKIPISMDISNRKVTTGTDHLTSKGFFSLKKIKPHSNPLFDEKKNIFC